jgi:hypothetical protein
LVIVAIVPTFAYMFPMETCVYDRDSMQAMTGEELRARIESLQLSFSEAAKRLGLSRSALYKQMTGDHRVSRQTEFLIGALEYGWKPPRPPMRRGSS